MIFLESSHNFWSSIWTRNKHCEAFFPQRLTQGVLDFDFKAARLNTHTHKTTLTSNRRMYAYKWVPDFSAITLEGRFVYSFQHWHKCLLGVPSFSRAAHMYCIFLSQPQSAFLSVIVVLFCHYSLCWHTFSPVLAPGDLWLFPICKSNLPLKKRFPTI